MLADRLNNDLKMALRSGDTVRRSVIRLLLAAIKNEELVKNGPLTSEEIAAALKQAGIALSRDQIQPALEASWAARRGEQPAGDIDPRAVAVLAEAGARKAEQAGALTDAEIEEVIRRQAKQRRDSIEAYRRAGRDDLAAGEEAELAVLQDYLPQPLTESELRALVRDVIENVGAAGPRDLGRVIPTVLERAGGRADGRAVSAMARDMLQQ